MKLRQQSPISRFFGYSKPAFPQEPDITPVVRPKTTGFFLPEIWRNILNKFLTHYY